MLARQLYEGIITENLYSNQVYLEIGSFDGEGIVMLSKKYPDKKFYSIDPFIEDGHTSGATGADRGSTINEIRSVFLKNTENCLNVFHFDMTDEEFMRKELYKNIAPDVLFIDGDHSFESCSLDLNLAVLFAKNKKNKRLFVVMDDMHIEGVVRALDRFKSEHPEIVFNSLKDYGAIYFYLS